MSLAVAGTSRPLKILQVHNRYRRPGGEDTVLANEARLLREHGHEVDLLEARNDDADPVSLPARLRLARDVVWSPSGTAAMAAALDRFQPDVVHVHNTFSQLSPAILRTVAAHRVPVVQTLHNFRLLCANGLLLREGRPCELCISDGRFNAVRHRCYRNSAAGSAVVSLSGGLHLLLGTFSRRGVRLIALTEFARGLLLRGGVPPRVLRVKPNFVYPQPAPHASVPREQRVVFVGRLAAEKGVDVLLEAWRQLALPGWTLELVGDGDLLPAAASLGDSVRCLGWISPAEVMARVSSARFLVMASRWYETFGMVLVEAFSAATPVIVPRLGAMGEIVEEGVSGLAYEPGDAASLAATLRLAFAMPTPAWHCLSDGALHAFESRFSPLANYRQLMSIYQDAIDELAS